MAVEDGVAPVPLRRILYPKPDAVFRVHCLLLIGMMMCCGTLIGISPAREAATGVDFLGVEFAACMGGVIESSPNKITNFFTSASSQLKRVCPAA